MGLIVLSAHFVGIFRVRGLIVWRPNSGSNFSLLKSTGRGYYNATKLRGGCDLIGVPCAFFLDWPYRRHKHTIHPLFNQLLWVFTDRFFPEILIKTEIFLKSYLTGGHLSRLIVAPTVHSLFFVR